MLKTLFAYWHKDRVSLQQGSISGIFTALAWNGISRGIGFIIRCIILLIWLVFSIAALIVSVIAMVLFFFWPFLAILSICEGVLSVALGGML